MLDIPIDGVPLAPNNLAWLDWGLRILRQTPLTRDESTSAVLMLSGLARWNAGLIRSITASERPADFDDRMMRELVTADRLPEVHAAMSEGVFSAEGTGVDPFSFAVERAFDGLALYMDEVAKDPKRRKERSSAPDEPAESEVYPRDTALKDATRDRREAERRLRDLRRKESELITKARRRSAARNPAHNQLGEHD